MFSCEHCEIFKNTYFEKHLPLAASADCKNFYRATESQIETWNKQTTCPSVFIVDFEQVSAGWEAKDGIDSEVRPATFLKMAQVFSCEFCEISNNTFSYRIPLVTASVNYRIHLNASKSLYWEQSK